MWLGLLAGSIAAFLVVRLLGGVVGSLSTQALANRGVLLMFLGWVSLATVGAATARMLRARNA